MNPTTAIPTSVTTSNNTNPDTNTKETMDIATVTKIRPDDILANLPAEDQQQLHEWLSCYSFRKVQKLAAQPRPDGLGLEVNFNTISRFYAKSRAAQHFNASETSHNPSQLLSIIHEKAQAELIDPDITLSEQARLVQLIIRMVSLQQRDRRNAQQEADLQLRRQSRLIATQRHNLHLHETLRNHFPVLAKINWDVEAQDAQTLNRLKSLLGLALTPLEANSPDTPNT